MTLEAEETREPAVAGRFYPGTPDTLAQRVAEYLEQGAAPESEALAVVAPHAGYMFSGAIAGATYARVRVPDRVIVMCPNHTGLGVPRSVWPWGTWRLPTAAVPVDAELAAELIRRGSLTPDRAAHFREHAVEVQLPFLVAKNPSVRVVPIVLAGLSVAECLKLGENLAESIRSVSRAGDRDVLIVASSDMSHYETAEDARSLDTLALERLLALDPQGLYRVVRDRGISMCGYIPTTVALSTALALGATGASLVRYGNSGETSGDFDRVVGYAGVLVS